MVHYTCEIPGLWRAFEPCVEKLNPDLMSESFLWIASCVIHLIRIFCNILKVLTRTVQPV